MTDEQLLAAIASAINSVQTNLQADMAEMKADIASMKSDMVAMKGDMATMKEDLLAHIHGVGAELHTQIQEVVERLDRMEKRADLQGGLIQGGARAITRMIEWTENADISFNRADRRITDVEKRLDQIDQK